MKPSLRKPPRHPTSRRPRASSGGSAAGGPLDPFDIELISYVCDRSDELGCGYELYTDYVAPLDRADRARLWAALEPVVSTTPRDAHLLRRRGLELRAVCDALGIGADLPDAFLRDVDTFHDLHLQGGASGLRAASKAVALARVGDLDPALVNAIAALAGLSRCHTPTLLRGDVGE